MVRREALAALVTLVAALSLACGGSGGTSPANPGIHPDLPTAKAAPADDGGWDGKSTLECPTGSRTITGVTAHLTSGYAIDASGNCALTLVNCDLSAPTAVEASGMAHVTIQGGKISGTDASVESSGMAVVAVNGATLSGPVLKGGSGQVEVNPAGATAPTVGSPPATPTTPTPTTPTPTSSPQATTAPPPTAPPARADNSAKCDDAWYKCKDRAKSAGQECWFGCQDISDGNEANACTSACNDAENSADRVCDDAHSACE